MCVGGGQGNAPLPSPTPMAGPQAPHQLNPALAATFQKLGVPIFPSRPYKRPTTAVKGVGGEAWGGGVVSSQAASGAEPQPQTILGVSCMCSFMQFHAHFSAFNSCLEIGDSYIPLLARILGLMFPFIFWGVTLC